MRQKSQGINIKVDIGPIYTSQKDKHCLVFSLHSKGSIPVRFILESASILERVQNFESV